MKKSTIWKSLAILGILISGYINVNAQTTRAVNGETLSQHGYNAAGNPVATEARDSVTTGGITRYYVVPDATANGAYSISVAGVISGTLNSSFWWATDNATSTAAGTIGQVGAIAYGNYRQVQWAGTGTIDLLVNEKSAAGCSDTANTKTIPIAVIAAPTTEFNVASEGRCISGADGSLTQTVVLPIRWTSSVPQSTRELTITYDIACDNTGFTGATGQTATVTYTSGNQGTITLPNVAYFGTYTITITAINDRISTKTGIDGTVADINTTGGAAGVYTLVINRIPQTGSVYHLPNM